MVAQTPPAIVQAAVTAAGAFWDRMGRPAEPGCPRPRVVFTRIDPDRAGQAVVAGCELDIQGSLEYDAQALCVLVTHEDGHARGIAGHDPNRNSIMADHSFQSTPECDRLGRFVRSLS